MRRLATMVLLILASWPAPAAAYRSHRSARPHYYRASRSRHHRSREVTREFEREHRCPSTGKHYGACPGYVKDHVRALCVGGADSPSNMQWQTVAEAKAKDKWECKR